MSISKVEAHQVAAKISPLFDRVLGRYDFKKYPAEEYTGFKSAFSGLNPNADQIRDAMIWKWGHWGKSNFLSAHKRLIREIQDFWPLFVSSGASESSLHTFKWWQDAFDRRTTYITAAYIAHLVHHDEPLPIIDQHNFRAMNSIIAELRPGSRSKKKPSSWEDIDSLKMFMVELKGALPGRSFSEIDRFLMMYGRYHSVR